jgi:transcriptional regulator with XRE-family HTH domain
MAAKKRSTAAASSAAKSMKAFGPRLKQLREDRGLSAAELARRAEVERIQINRYERGLTLPALDSVVRLAKVLRVTLDELLTGQRPTLAEPPISNLTLLDLFQQVDQLPASDQDAAIGVLEGLVARHRLQSLAGSMRRSASA